MKLSGPSCTRALREQALGSEHHHPLLALRFSREKEKKGPILTCELSVSWWPLLGPRLDAENEATDCWEPKEIVCGWRNVFRQDSVQPSFSQGVLPQWKVSGCPSASCNHPSQPGYSVLLLCVLQVLWTAQNLWKCWWALERLFCSGLLH